MNMSGVQTQIYRITQNVANTYAVLAALGADMPDEQTSDNLSPTAGTAKAVLYSEQDLDGDQQAQARANIGAMSDTTSFLTIGSSLTLSKNHADGIYFISSGDDVTITLPGSYTFPMGHFVTLVQKTSGINVTLSTGSGVTLYSKNNCTKIAGEFSAVTLFKAGLNEWWAWGDLA